MATILSIGVLRSVAVKDLPNLARNPYLLLLAETCTVGVSIGQLPYGRRRNPAEMCGWVLANSSIAVWNKVNCYRGIQCDLGISSNRVSAQRAWDRPRRGPANAELRPEALIDSHAIFKDVQHRKHV